MSGNRAVVITLGATLALAGGGLAYYAKVYQPDQQRGAARDEIARWEQRVAAAHACLLGEKPASAKPGEALAIRELAPDPWDRASCTKLVGKLARGVAEDTGLLPVEHAWMTVDRAAAKVANAFALHVDADPDRRDRRRAPSPLPAALDGLEGARAELRTAAGLAPFAAAGTALPAAEVIAVTAGGAPVSALTAWFVPSAGGTVAFGTVKSQGEVQLTIAPGATPRAIAIPASALRAVPALAWGAAGLRTQVAIGPIDAAGAFGPRTTVPVELGARVLAAVGAPTNGLVAYAASNELVIARSTGAAFAADRPLEVGRITAALDPAGRALVAWSTLTDEPALRGFLASDGAPPKILDLGEGVPSQSCLTAAAAFVATREQVVSFGPAGATPFAIEGLELVGCGAEAAVLHRPGTTHFAVCSATCRDVDLPTPRPFAVATVAAGTLVAIGTRDRVLGAWSEGVPPRFFATPGPVTPILAASDGKVIDVLAESEAGVVVVRLPR